MMENQEKVNEAPAYKVYDEMACEVLIATNNFDDANYTAYNHQCVLLDNRTGKVIHDYSC
jgi:hypothetical protein